MKQFTELTEKLEKLVRIWEPKLSALSAERVSEKRNSQNRNIRQIVGHMADSATNNTHRIVHMHYQQNPINYPDYANHGNNDRWIAIQNYEQENWNELVQLWKYAHLHICHVINQAKPEKLQNKWVSALKEEVSMKEMISDFPRHFQLHISQIEELLK